MTDRIAPDAGEPGFTAIRASGPGGQNGNKVSSAVQLRFDAARSPSLSEAVRAGHKAAGAPPSLEDQPMAARNTAA